MQRIDVTPLVKPMLEAFHHGTRGLMFGHETLIDMFGDEYADKFQALSRAPDYAEGVRSYLSSEDLTLDQLKEAASTVQFGLTDPEWDDADLAGALEAVVNDKGLSSMEIKGWNVYDSYRRFFSWENNSETLYPRLSDMVEDSQHDVLEAFRAACEDPLDYVHEHVRSTYIRDRADALIEHIENLATDDEGVWAKFEITPEYVPANKWYAVDSVSSHIHVVNFNGMFILPVKE